MPGDLDRERPIRAIRTHPGWNAAGWVLLALAAALALFLGGLAVLQPRWVPFEGVAAALALLGAWAVWRGQSLHVDWAGRRLRLSRRQSIAFAEVDSVELRTLLEERGPAHAGTTERLYRVDLVKRGADPQMDSRVANARQAIDQAAGGAPTTTGIREALREELVAIRPAALANTFFVAQHTDELRMWRVAEKLARTLDVPLEDYCGDTLVIRTPLELDVPLGLRLARLGVAPQDPGPAPAALRDLSVGDGLSFEWGTSGWTWGAAGLALLGTAASLAGWLTWADLFEIRMVFAVLGACLWLWAVWLAFGQRRELCVDDREITARMGSWPRPRRSIPLGALEMVRATRAPYEAIHLVSDSRVVECRLPAGTADWLRARLEHFVVGKPAAA